MARRHAVFPDSSWGILVLVFLEPGAEVAFRFPDVFMGGVLVACDLIDYPTFVDIWCFVFWVYKYGSQLVSWLMVRGYAI